MIWWTIIAAFAILLAIFALGGTCYDWGWQRGYRDGIGRSKQIDRLAGAVSDGFRPHWLSPYDPALRGWNPLGHCCHGIPIENACIDCASLTAGGGFDA